MVQTRSKSAQSPPAAPAPPAPQAARDSSMPNMTAYTTRLRKLADLTPSKQSRTLQSPARVFTGASSARANSRRLRLAPPSSAAIAKRDAAASRPPFFGADATVYARRTRRYKEVRNATAAVRGGAPVFSGASANSYAKRMLRLRDRS